MTKTAQPVQNTDAVLTKIRQQLHSPTLVQKELVHLRDFKLKLNPQNEGLNVIEDHDLRTIIEENPRKINTQVAEKLKIEHTVILKHLRTIGKIKELMN